MPGPRRRSSALVVLAAVLLALFVLVESRARRADPAARRSSATGSSRVASAIGFIVGLALFGAITYLPLYLQVVKGASPTRVRARADAADGRAARVVDRQRAADHEDRAATSPSRSSARRSWRVGDGAAVAARPARTPSCTSALSWLVLGARARDDDAGARARVQNAVDYGLLGVATSGSTLSRQIGGSIGVSSSGDLRQPAQRPSSRRRARPVRTACRAQANPAVDPAPAARGARAVPREAFAAALTPVFVVAGRPDGSSPSALTWLLREMPLRETAEAEGIGEAIRLAARRRLVQGAASGS